MRIRLLSITHKVPIWVKQGFEEYRKRLPLGLSLELIEIPAEKRSTQTDLKRIEKKESEKIFNCIHPSYRIIALDMGGKKLNSLEISNHLSLWQQQEKGIDFLIGGPEGLPKIVLSKANETWSLSNLTFPHTLVRIILAEQLYRASTLLSGHPYHR